MRGEAARSSPPEAMASVTSTRSSVGTVLREVGEGRRVCRVSSAAAGDAAVVRREFGRAVDRRRLRPDDRLSVAGWLLVGGRLREQLVEAAGEVAL